MTPKRRKILEALGRNRLTARGLADLLETPEHNTTRYTYGEVYRHLHRALQDDHVGCYKQGVGRGQKVWFLTDKGRLAMEDD